MKKLRICFAGTPAFAAAHLQTLLKAGHHVVAVYTQPDRPSGRGKKLQASPVKQIALEHMLPVFQPSSLRPLQETETLASLDIDLMIVVAYGLILPKSILDVPRLGCLNVHASLLPRWRGAAPIERALLAGDKVSGVTIMQMDEGLDTGAMLTKESVPISATDNRIDLEEKLQIAGQTALTRTLNDLEKYQSGATVQNDEDSNYAAKVEKAEAFIDWRLSAPQIDRQIRAGIGRNPAYTLLNDQRLRILEGSVSMGNYNAEAGQIVASEKAHFTVSCGSGALDVQRVQLPGKKPATVKDISNSRPELFSRGVAFDRKQPK
ncbi:MAG: methionyl-tRNA formyltransferase [SAR86 cluster bacterium]|uniref:Methionyl-tRNA formyltransferase n=1 Tax=SAR86 cluster bacterium TaxID=2030880 RepID=A0A2A4WY06_9GAMM|nr:MAG: methionyl-tRNA formyltransferase [SAR86 cluster bacterium]